MVKKTPEIIVQGETRVEAEADPGNIRVEAVVELPPDSEVQITIQYRRNANAPHQKQVVTIKSSSQAIREKVLVELEKIPVHFHPLEWLRRNLPTSPVHPSFPVWLLVASLLVYYLVRLIHLSDFPIFFFTDEAVHTMLAADLVRDGFRGSGGEFLPTFFRSGSAYNAGFPVYLQVLPVLLGIRSVFITRFISVTVTLLAAIGVGLIFSEINPSRRGWLAVLVLSIVPAWFYHSRTAFETVEAVSFFVVFLLGYIKYRNGKYHWLKVSVVAAALAFYSYSPARVVMGFMGIFLLFSDLRYHWKMRRFLLIPFLMGLVLILPYARFLILHPNENSSHLQLLNSYWMELQPFYWKILQFIKIYLQGLNPFYWFFPNEVDLSRHIMNGMGHLGWFFLPFFITGLVVSIMHWKQPVYRVLIFALLAAPTGAAVVEIGITRAMFMVIPAALFTAIGLDIAFNKLQSLLRIEKSLDVYLFVVMAIVNLLFLDHVLTYGPRWFNNYGMGGMQYGGQQVFDRIKEIRRQNSTVPIVLSPDWANGTDVLARFHMGDPVPIELSSMDAYINSQKGFSADTIFIMTPDDYNKVIASDKFDPMKVVDVLFYPDDTPGFVFANLKYNQAARQAFQVELESRKYLDTAQIDLNGEEVLAASSRLDIGTLQAVFDNDPQTLIRSLEANPLIVEILFPDLKAIQSAWVMVGGSATRVDMYVLTEDSDIPLAASISVPGSPETKKVTIPLPTGQPIYRMRFEVSTISDGEPAHVHVWDIGLQ